MFLRLELLPVVMAEELMMSRRDDPPSPWPPPPCWRLICCLNEKGPPPCAAEQEIPSAIATLCLLSGSPPRDPSFGEPTEKDIIHSLLHMYILGAVALHLCYLSPHY